MDSIAIPQFAAGAMENWGLNTYRDAYLIYKPGDPESSKIGVAETLAHELSHQWFGNLATCQWWDQMWLNEGLATYFTYKSLVFVAPEYDTEMRYIVRHHQNSLRFDSDANRSHPVVIPTDGFNFFDGTSMEKGGSLTRMMDYLFTFPVLQASLRTYLQRKYALTVTSKSCGYYYARFQLKTILNFSIISVPTKEQFKTIYSRRYRKLLPIQESQTCCHLM